MTAVLELARLSGLGALLLSFAILAGGRAQPAAYAAQCAAIVVAALCQMVLQGDWTLALVASVLAAQAGLLWWRRVPVAGRGAFPFATVCAALLLVVLAIATTPSEGMGVPLAILLLGLLGAASVSGPYGVLSLLNGVLLGMVVAPALPLRLPTTLALAALALGLAMEAGLPARVRR